MEETNNKTNIEKMCYALKILKKNIKLPILEVGGIKNITCKFEKWENLIGLSFKIYTDFKSIEE